MTERSDDVHKELPVKLTPAELLHYGDQMADCEMAIEKYKAERSRIGDAIRAEQGARLRLAKFIDDGTEPRRVLCRWIESISENCKRLIRQDTGEEVDVEALTAADRQMSLQSPVPPGETIDLDEVPDDDDDDDADEETVSDPPEPDTEPDPPPPVAATSSRRRSQRQQPSA